MIMMTAQELDQGGRFASERSSRWEPEKVEWGSRGTQVIHYFDDEDNDDDEDGSYDDSNAYNPRIRYSCFY